MAKDLLTEWTTQAYGLLDNVYDPKRVETLNNTILDLSKLGITDLVLYNVADDSVTVRYNKRGSKTFQKVSI